MYFKSIGFFIAIYLFMGTALIAQNPNASNTKVKITTQTRALPTLEEQVLRLEQQVAWAREQPQLVKDGTLAKYEKALAERRAALARENEERARIELEKLKKQQLKD